MRKRFKETIMQNISIISKALKQAELYEAAIIHHTQLHQADLKQKHKVTTTKKSHSHRLH